MGYMHRFVNLAFLFSIISHLLTILMRQKLDCIPLRLCVTFLALFICLGSFAQKTIIGKVLSSKDNSPVAFATITVKGTNVAAVSGADGSFTINAPGSNTTLVVSSVGFTTKEVDGSAGNVSVTLVETTSSLDEIVVTGYTAQRKKEITGAVSVVNVKELRQVPAGTGEEALQGRASGVNVITSGQPGAASEIRIRGITNFGNNQPLVIIDGVQASLTDINTADVESIQVLKDGSAAIYGVRGANGVIIVTSKKGRSGKATVTYDGYYGITTPGPGYNMANPTEASRAIWQQQRNSGIANPSSKQYGSGTEPVLPDYITPTGYTLCNCPADSDFVSPSLYDINTYQITRANKTGTDWYDEITRTAARQSHNVSVSAGNDRNHYFFSVGYFDQQGIGKFQYLKRYSVRANTQFSIGNHIRVGEDAYVFYKRNPKFGNQGEGSPFSMSFREDPIIPVYDIMGNFGGTKSQDLGNARNPYADIYRTKDNRNNNWDIIGTLYGEVDFLKHFTFRTSFGGSIDNYYYYNFNYVGYENAEGNTGLNSFTEGAGYGSNWTYTNTLAYNNLIGEHSIRALIGIEAVNNYGRNLSGTRSDYFSENPNYWVLNAGSPTGQANAGSAYQQSIWSQFAKVEYGYAGKYLINGTLRRDGVSVFAPDQRYNVFPGVSLAWVISQENFMKDISWINNLKIRGSWAQLGSYTNVNATNPYDLYASRAGKSFYDISGTNTSPTAGFYRSNLGNPETTWEEDILTNIGFDATLFNNKFDISIDWFKKKINGLLFTASGAQYSRVFTGDPDLPRVNIGDNQNTGIDFNATYHGTIGKDLKIDLTAIFTSYKNEIVSIPGANYFEPGAIRNVVIQRNQVGHAYGEFFGYKVIGLFQDADEVSKAPVQDGAEPGVFRYADINGDNKIDADDRTFIGNPNPDFTYGFNIALSYKNFDFSAFFSGSQGNDIFNQTKYFTDFPDFFKGAIRREAAVNSWTPDNTNTNIAKLKTTGSFSTDLVTNSYFVSKGSYLRCKQMQIGYNFRTAGLTKMGVTNLRVYVQGADLFTLTKYDGLDPELQTPPDSNGQINTIGAFGVDQGNYPHTAAFLFGINLSF